MRLDKRTKWKKKKVQNDHKERRATEEKKKGENHMESKRGREQWNVYTLHNP